MRRALAIVLAILAIGSIRLTYPTSAPRVTVETVEAGFGALAPGSVAGVNMTNASVSLAASLVGATDQVLYLNNSNASGAYHVRLVQTSAVGIADITTLNIGVDNGTSTDQIRVAAGLLTQSSGAYVQLPPASTNRIYVTSLVGALFGTGTIDFDVYVSDDAAESAYYVMKGSITVT